MNSQNLQETALRYATQWHEGQCRRGSDASSNRVPYITHCIGVKNMLVDAGIEDDTILAAALLHDTVEDCDVTHNMIRGIFGADVSELVMQLTDEPDLSRSERHRIQSERMAWIDERSILIKMADRIYNLRDFTKEAPIMIQDGSKHRLTSYLQFAKNLHFAIEDRARLVAVERVHAWNSLLEALSKAICDLEEIVR